MAGPSSTPGSGNVNSDALIRSLIALVNGSAQVRQFTILPVLKTEKDLRGWNADLGRTLARHELLKYIDDDVPRHSL
jgi:hypothetical protein